MVKKLHIIIYMVCDGIQDVEIMEFKNLEIMAY